MLRFVLMYSITDESKNMFHLYLKGYVKSNIFYGYISKREKEITNGCRRILIQNVQRQAASRIRERDVNCNIGNFNMKLKLHALCMNQ